MIRLQWLECKIWSRVEPDQTAMAAYINKKGTVRDNNAEGIVFRKPFNKQETFRGGWKTSKSNLKTYSQNLEKNIFCSEIYDFVVIFS